MKPLRIRQVIGSHRTGGVGSFACYLPSKEAGQCNRTLIGLHETTWRNYRVLKSPLHLFQVRHLWAFLIQTVALTKDG